MPTILITGGTGLIGSALSTLLLSRGYDIILLTRQSIPPLPVLSASPEAKSVTTSVSTGPDPSMDTRSNPSSPKSQIFSAHAPQPLSAHWDPGTQSIDPEAIRRADHIIHLAGAGVADKRWSPERKQEIVDSRVRSSACLVKALREIPNKVQSVTSASAIGWYGPDASVPYPEPFMETNPPAKDFLGETCRLWEESIAPVTDLGKRLTILRTGIVLSPHGGALAEFKKPVRFGLAAILGTGAQLVSWIHIDDLCRLYLRAVEDAQWQGVYNAVAPGFIDNRNIVLKLAKQMKGRFFVPIFVPTFLLRMVLGEMSIEVLKSVSVSAGKVHRAGFQFLYPSLDAAMPSLV